MEGQNTRHIRNIALVGFMGVGKSSVGRILADQLQFQFLDTDAEIEARAGRTIADIFSQAGEAAFRTLERGMVEELAKRSDLVIATGGGLICDPNNLASLKEHALTVCLWASAETIWNRVRTQTHRPLLQAPDPLGRIRELLELRRAIYRQSDVLLGTELRSPREVAMQALHHFHLSRKGRP